MTKPLSEQVAELEAERDELHQGYITQMKTIVDLKAERDDLQRQVQEARDEVDALPRAITADELREGQTVAVYSDRSGVAAGVVYDLEPDVFRLDPGFHHSRTRYRPWMLSAIHGETIVLLQDAPQPTSYADDDHQDAEVTQWWNPEPETTTTRLTATDGTMWEVSVRAVNDATLTTPEAQ